jgi:hypothetical protein
MSDGDRRSTLSGATGSGMPTESTPEGAFTGRSGGKNALTVSRGSAYVEWTISEGNSHG